MNFFFLRLSLPHFFKKLQTSNKIKQKHIYPPKLKIHFPCSDRIKNYSYSLKIGQCTNVSHIMGTLQTPQTELRRQSQFQEHSAVVIRTYWATVLKWWVIRLRSTYLPGGLLLPRLPSSTTENSSRVTSGYKRSFRGQTTVTPGAPPPCSSRCRTQLPFSGSLTYGAGRPEAPEAGRRGTVPKPQTCHESVPAGQPEAAPHGRPWAEAGVEGHALSAGGTAARGPRPENHGLPPPRPHPQTKSPSNHMATLPQLR